MGMGCGDCVLFPAEPSSVKKLMRTEDFSSLWPFFWLNLDLGCICGMWAMQVQGSLIAILNVRGAQAEQDSQAKL